MQVNFKEVLFGFSKGWYVLIAICRRRDYFVIGEEGIAPFKKNPRNKITDILRSLSRHDPDHFNSPGDTIHFDLKKHCTRAVE